MTTYAKPSVGPAWAETAANPADIITMSSADVQAGWPSSGTPPSRQRFNYILNWATKGMRYLMQRGIPEFDIAETYQVGSCVVWTDGNTYKCKVSNSIGNPCNNIDWWELWAFTLTQINASQVTQANIGTGDSSTKVANTNFVASAISQLASTVAANLAAVDASLIIGDNYIIGLVNSLTTTVTNNYNSLVSQIASYVTGGLLVSLSTNGYIKFPTWASGLTIQWGNITNSPANTVNSSSFPHNFDHACFAVVGSAGQSTGTGGGMSFWPTSAAGFSYYNSNNLSNAYWIAVGW